MNNLTITDIQETEKGFLVIIEDKYKYRFYNKRMNKVEMGKRAKIEHRLYLECKNKALSKETILLMNSI